MHGGDLQFDTPMLFSIGTVTMFVIGGLSGVTHCHRALGLPADRHLLRGGALPLRAVRRRGLRPVRGDVLLVAEGLRAPALARASGKVQFWIMLIGFNLTFGPMHVLGLQRHDPPRVHLPGVARADVLEPGASIGRRVPDRARDPRSSSSTWSAPSRSRRALENDDPWDARTIEWTTSCPPPRAQLRRDPARSTRWTSSGTASTSRTRRPATLVPVQAGAAPDHDAGHAAGRARDPSAQPVVLAAGGGRRAADASAYGILYSWWLVGPGRHRGAGGLLRMGARALGGGGSSRGDGVDDRRSPSRRRRAPDHHRPAEHEARDVAVPVLGVPAVRRADHHLRAVPRRQRQGPVSQRRLRHPATRRCRRSCCWRPRSRWCWRWRRRSSATWCGCGCGSSPPRCSGMTFVGGQVYEFTSVLPRGPDAQHEPVRVHASTCSPASTGCTSRSGS